MKQNELLGYSSGVSVDVEGENITFGSAIKRVRVRIPDTGLRNRLMEMTDRPVKSTEISDGALAFLREHDLITAAAHPAHLQALRAHAEGSMPLNRGLAYTADDLRAYQEHARTARFLPGAVPGGADLPLPLRRRPSFAPFDGPPARPVDADTLTAVMRTAHDPDTRLYPSAGALYPVRLIAEQVCEDYSELTAFDPDRGVLRTRRAPLDTRPPALRLDPTLAAVSTRFWLVADLADTTAKYGVRGYRYAAIEAGHAAQTLIQTLGHAGIETRPFGGFDDAAMAAHLHLPPGWVPLCAVGAVPRASGADWVEAEELRCVLVNKQPLYYATAFGAKVKDDQRECGFGVDTTTEGARVRARGELAERLTLMRSDRELRNSNGMAAHTRTTAAADAAVLELYERHCYLRTWFLGTSPTRLDAPETPLAAAVQSLCRSSGVGLTFLDIADPHYGVSAVMTVVHSDAHGGVITASGAGADEEEATARALREIAKALFYRLVLRKTTVFTDANPVDGAITQPWEHEAYFAHEKVPTAVTRFLTDGPERRGPVTTATSLDPLYRVTEVQDMSDRGPDAASWKIARATSEHLLTVDFGTPSTTFRERVRTLLGDDIDVDARWPHPLG